MKLYEVEPRAGKKVRVVDLSDAHIPPAHRELGGRDDVYTFSHIDGMYSLCIDSDNQFVHLGASTEVEIVE